MCFVFIWEQTATCVTYSINWLVFITQMKSVYCAVRTGSLNKAVCASYLKGWYLGKTLTKRNCMNGEISSRLNSRTPATFLSTLLSLLVPFCYRATLNSKMSGNIIFVCCFIWVWNLVTHIEGVNWFEGVREQWLRKTEGDWGRLRETEGDWGRLRETEEGWGRLRETEEDTWD